jgi:hypothetical protein
MIYIISGNTDIILELSNGSVLTGFTNQYIFEFTNQQNRQTTSYTTTDISTNTDIFNEFMLTGITMSSGMYYVSVYNTTYPTTKLFYGMALCDFVITRPISDTSTDNKHKIINTI